MVPNRPVQPVRFHELHLDAAGTRRAADLRGPPASLCFRLPESLSSEEGALIEPLAVALGAVNESGASVGVKATVLGSGCIGLMTLLSLKAAGVADVSVVDIHGIRLEKAKQLGAAHTINASTDEPVSAVRDLYGGTGPHLVFGGGGQPEDGGPDGQDGTTWRHTRPSGKCRRRDSVPTAGVHEEGATAAVRVPLREHFPRGYRGRGQPADRHQPDHFPHL